MALTREFKHTVTARVQRDPRFRSAVYGGDQCLPRRRYRDRQSHLARFGEHHRRVRGIGGHARQAEQEPSPDAGSEWQPQYRKLLRDRECAAKEDAGEVTCDGQGELSAELRVLRWP